MQLRYQCKQYRVDLATLREGLRVSWGGIDCHAHPRRVARQPPPALHLQGNRLKKQRNLTPSSIFINIILLCQN